MILFAINPGLSFSHTTGVFPNLLDNCFMVSIVSSDVLFPRVISASFIKIGGLKKCNPHTFSGLSVAFANSLILMFDVLEAKIAPLGEYFSKSVKILSFNSRFSGAASITTSAFLTASTIEIEVVTLLITSAEGIFPFSASF